MKKITTLIAMVLLPVLAFPAMAGVEPSPFQPELNKLNSIVNCLSEVNQRVSAALTRMGVGPSPFIPVVNQLEAEASQLDLLSVRLEGVLAAIPEEDQVGDAEVNAALLQVKAGAELIVDATGQGDVGDVPPSKEVIDAMQRVHESAQAIVDQILGPN